MKTWKVLSIICRNGKQFECIYNSEKEYNQYTLYYKYYESGKHRKKVISYGNLASVLAWLTDYENNISIQGCVYNG